VVGRPVRDAAKLADAAGEVAAATGTFHLVDQIGYGFPYQEWEEMLRGHERSRAVVEISCRDDGRHGQAGASKDARFDYSEVQRWVAANCLGISFTPPVLEERTFVVPHWRTQPMEATLRSDSTLQPTPHREPYDISRPLI